MSGLRPHAGAPNVLVVLLDDTGFGLQRLTGRGRWVQIDLDVDDHDHLITPEERLRTAMARQ